MQKYIDLTHNKENNRTQSGREGGYQKAHEREPSKSDWKAQIFLQTYT